MNLYTISDALAQVTKNGIELGGIFDKLKIDIESYEEVIRRFSELNLDKPQFKLDNGKANWDAITKAIGECDETALSYFKTLDDGKGNIDNTSASVEGMSAYLKKSGQMFDFAAVKATLLNTALNAGIFLVASLAIQGIAKALDNYIHRVEKANEAMDEAVSEYNSAKSSLESVNTELDEQNKKLDDLLAKDKLTYAEKGQLEELQAITQELLLQQDIEEKRANNASRDAADKAVDAFEKQYGRYDKTEDKLKEKLSYENFPIPEDKNDILGIVAGYVRAKELLAQSQKDYDEAIANKEDTTWLADDLQYNIDAVGDYTQALDDSLSDLLEKRTALEDEYNRAIEKRETGLEPLTTSEKDVIETYESIYDIMRIVYEYTDPNTWKSMQIEDVFNTEGIEKTKEELVEMVKAGTFDESTLQSYPKLSEALEQNKVSASELRNELEALADEQGNIQSSTPNIETPISLSISQTVDQLNTQIKPAFDSLKSAWQDIFADDGFALNDIDIISTCDSIKSKLDEMSELGLTVDYSAFEDFVRVLNNTESTESDVETAFDSLATSITNAGLSGTEDFETMKAALEDLGVVNSNIIAFQALVTNTAALQETIQNAGLTMDEFVISTNDGKIVASEAAQAFVEEMVGAENCQQALALLQLQQVLVTENSLNTTDDINACLTLATSAGVAVEALQQLLKATALYDSAVASGDTVAQSAAITAIAAIKVKINSEIANFRPAEIDFSPIGNGAKSAGKSAGKSYKEGLEEELNDLNSVISGVTGRIDEQIGVIRSQKEAALEAIDAQIDALNEQKSALEAEKKALEDARDAAVEALEEERDLRIEVIEQQKKQLEENIKLIDKQINDKEKVIKGIQAEIDAMQDANEERKRQIDLQKAQYELERLQHQRTILLYSEDKGMHYVTDTKGIRDKKQAVDDAKLEIEIANKQKQIDLVEKEIDLLNEKKDAINEQIDLLDEQIDRINEFYDTEIEKTKKYYDEQIKAIDAQIESIDKQIEALQKQREQTEKYYESLIGNLEKSKSKYEELTEIVEKAELSAALKQLGIDEEALLNGSEEEFNKLKNAYMDIVTQLNSGNDEVLSSLQELSGYDGTAPAVLSDSNTELDEMNGKLDDSNQSVQSVNSSLGETATTTNDVASNVGDLTSSLSEANSLVTEEQTAFNNLKQTITEVIEAIDQKTQVIQEEQNAVGTATGAEMANFELLKNKILEVKETLDSISNSVTTLDTTPVNSLTTAFQLLYDQLLLVASTLGAGMEGQEEGAVSGITSAIQALNEISLEEGIIAQFDNLKTAIDSVTSAISGGGGESSEGEGQGGSGTKSKGGESGGKGSEGEGGGGNSLTGAITEMGETAKEVIGEPDAEGDGTVIGEFGALETAVNDVTSAISSGDSEGGEGEGKGSGSEGEGNLIGSIVDLGETTEETLGAPDGDGAIGRFEQFKVPIQEAEEHVQGISDGLDEIDGKEVECTITVNVKQNGNAYAEGTVLGSMNLNSSEYTAKYGKAFAEGTGKYKGLPKDEKNALVSEYGQTEMTVLPNGNTIITDEPTMMDLPKDTVIYNEEQTKKIMDNKVDAKVVTSYADGTVEYSDGTIVRPDGVTLRPLQPGDRAYELQKAFEPLLKKIDGNLEYLTGNVMAEHNKQMEKWINQLNTTNVVNNNKPSINIGDIHITCPGVTSKEVAQQIGTALKKEFQGMSLNAYQKMNITR